jgi:acetyl esterase/lipase
MKLRLLFAGIAGFTMAAHSQSTNSFPLWPKDAPGALGDAAKDVPTLTPFPADPTNATGAAFIVCPGGGYEHLAPHEGRDYARWLNEQGISAFVLKYRLGSSGYHHPAMLQDGARAIRFIRAHAAEWKIDPQRIGIIGSSAGGHLASTVMTHFDAGDSNATDVIERQSSRPDLAILCYPVVTMGKFAHAGSKRALLGTNATPEELEKLVKELSSELHVKKDTPPCFLWSTFEDKTVPVENTLQFADALRQAQIPFELHIYEKGPHGLGLGSHTYDPSKWLPWTRDCAAWLKLHEFGK